MRTELKDHLLREMLLEDEDYKKILVAVKKYQTNPTEEQKEVLVTNLREKLTVKAKELLATDQITKFIDGLGQVGDIEE
jgi:hypothetical protein